MEIINQRQIYLDTLKKETREFWIKVVEDYNNGIPVSDIRLKYENPKTGKPYSRSHIHSIIKRMREAKE